MGDPSSNLGEGNFELGMANNIYGVLLRINMSEDHGVIVTLLCTGHKNSPIYLWNQLD